MPVEQGSLELLQHPVSIELLQAKIPPRDALLTRAVRLFPKGETK